jgi:hypothetical protein
MDRFDIIEYISGLTSYVFDKSVLKRIAVERNVIDVVDYSELSKSDKDLIFADLLYTAYLSPTTIASSSVSHGAFSKSIGGQTVSKAEKEYLYNRFYSIYKKYNDDKLFELDDASLQWLSI